MALVDILMLISLVSIWLLLLLNIVLIISGYRYYAHCEKRKLPQLERAAMVSVLVPAHNEGKVIARTIEALLRLDYPMESYEIIVVNDNSSDDSAKILRGIQERYPERALKVINTDAKTGGRGKSRALNIALKESLGEIIAIYDADNTPEPSALRFLVAELLSDDKLGAVIGKFRTRNKEVNLLTRFINIETLAYQWMVQAGRWQLMKLNTIPGTNYVIRRSIIDDMSGWDEKALAEDTEMSYRVYLKGYLIKFLPMAVTWEQEPQTVKTWFHQRSRWVQGNVYVLVKNLPLLFKKGTGKVRFDIIYFLCTYFLLLGSLLVSDYVFIGNALGLVHASLAQFSSLLWLMAITLFVMGTFVVVSTEKGEMTFSNLGITALMYFTYSKMWMVVAFYGLCKYIYLKVMRREAKWKKTERFDER